MALAALSPLASSPPVAVFVAAGLASVWFAIALTLWFAARRLPMPAVAVLGLLGAIGLALFFLWATAEGGQP
jgi:hypothetical protein